MAEWSIAAVLKTAVPQGTGGSNPSLSAKAQNSVFQQAWTQKQPLLVPPDKPWKELRVDAMGIHLWEEHCVECAPPDCYASCSLFVERSDKKCARFVSGIAPNPNVTGLEGLGFQIRFRRWAKLEAKFPAHSAMFSQEKAVAMGKRLNRTEKAARMVANVLRPFDAKRKVQGAQYAYHQRIQPTITGATDSESFDGFYMEMFAPEGARFVLEVVGKQGVFLRHGLSLDSGWNRAFIDREQWPVSMPEGALVRLINEENHEVDLVITALHLVRWSRREDAIEAFAETVSEPTDLPKIKCVVFDLDNTLWTGVIGDDGAEGVDTREEALELISELDRRGIICAVASKNEFDLAWSKIEELGLGEHLLFPQIHWGAKSQSVQQIASDMNVNPNTLAFIDDNPFERREVQAAMPMVRVFPETRLLALLDRTDFDVPVTEQASKRRLSYLAESKRVRTREQSGADADQFLRSCNMRMRLLSPAEHRERCLEMLDRTNQFNISGKRYSASEFDELLTHGYHCCWSVEDDYGDYGIVGYLRAEQHGESWVVEDFVMSCRVAQKRVEEALFTALSDVMPATDTSLRIRLIPTGRNAPILKKLGELGVEGEDGLTVLHATLQGSDVVGIIRDSE